MSVLNIPIPEGVDHSELKMQIGAFLFQKGVLSSGQAAELAGITRRAFLEKIGDYGVSIFGETVNDIAETNDLEI